MNIQERLEALKDLVVRSEIEIRYARGPGIAWNERHGEKPYEGENATRAQAQQMHSELPPKEKWCAYIGHFGAWDDDVEQAVAKLEAVVHSAVRKDIVARVEKARIRLKNAEAVMLLVEDG